MNMSDQSPIFTTLWPCVDSGGVRYEIALTNLETFFRHDEACGPQGVGWTDWYAIPNPLNFAGNVCDNLGAVTSLPIIDGVPQLRPPAATRPCPMQALEGEFRRWHAEGATSIELRMKTGMCLSTVVRWQRVWGLRPNTKQGRGEEPRRGHNRLSLKDKMRDRFVYLHGRGYTPPMISRTLAVGMQSIRKWHVLWELKENR